MTTYDLPAPIEGEDTTWMLGDEPRNTYDEEETTTMSITTKQFLEILGDIMDTPVLLLHSRWPRHSWSSYGRPEWAAAELVDLYKEWHPEKLDEEIVISEGEPEFSAANLRQTDLPYDLPDLITSRVKLATIDLPSIDDGDEIDLGLTIAFVLHDIPDNTPGWSSIHEQLAALNNFFYEANGGKPLFLAEQLDEVDLREEDDEE